MGDLIEKLEEIKQLPPELHLFCPRQNDHDFDRYEQPALSSNAESEHSGHQETARRIKDAGARRSKFIDAMGLIAFDGADTESYKEYIWERLNEAMSKCDLCIPGYYLAKLDMRDSLQQQFEDEEVRSFFAIIDNVDIERIVSGLDRARRTLLSVPPQSRNLSCLDQASLFSIFEALSCEAFLHKGNLLEEHFDEPFKLIQQKKSLRTRDYVPAATRFLFDPEVQRFKWASVAWTRYSRPPTDVEWTWTVREILQKRFTQTYEERSPTLVWRLWNGLRFIIERLDQPQITHNLRSLEPDVSKMALEHLAVKTPGLKFIIQSVKLLLQKSPFDFWDAMASISPVTVTEQIFSSPFYDTLLQEIGGPGSEGEPNAVQMLSWIPVFVSSLKAANQPPACRALAVQLFRRANDPGFKQHARLMCRKAGLRVLLQLLQQFIDSPQSRQSVGRVVLSDALDVVGQHILSILRKARDTLEDADEVGVLAMDVIRISLDLECQMLKADYLAISGGDTTHQVSTTYTPDIWCTIVDNLHADDLKLSEATLRGTLALPGLEKLIHRRSKAPSKESSQYNDIYDKMMGLLKQILEKIADFAPEHLDQLFKTQEISMPLLAALFSSETDICMAASDLIKNVSGQPGKKEALVHLLRAFPGTSVFSLSWAFRRIASMRTFAPVPRVLKTGMDILDVLTDTHTGILRDNTLEPRDIQAVRAYWTYQWFALKTVFKETERWHSLNHDKALMTEVCRDAMQYAEALFEQYDVFANAVTTIKSEVKENVDNLLLENITGSPAATLQAMSKWLRLRDEYLSATLVKLITNMLHRLSDHDVRIPEEGLGFIEEVAVKRTIKTMLSAQQKAELVRALETYLKRPIVVDEPVKTQKRVTDWTRRMASNDGSESQAASLRHHKAAELDEVDATEKDVVTLSTSVERNKARLLESRAVSSKPKAVLTKQLSSIKSTKPSVPKSQGQVNAFLENRRKETEARKARDREAAALLRGKGGVGVTKIGESIMVSSENDSDSEDEMERQLFGSRVRTVQRVGSEKFPEMTKAVAQKSQVPVKKVKRLLHRNDMRARLAPDLSSLHHTLLSWDFFAETDLPPNSTQQDYTMVTNTFSNVSDYQRTFESLLILEAWQSFRSAREERVVKPFEIKISNRLTVDDAVQVNATMSMTVAKELGLGLADVVLLSRNSRPQSAPADPHCLARIKEKNFKQGQLELVLRVNIAQNTLLSLITRDACIWGQHLLSLTPLEREYGALKALAFYDLCDEVIHAAPSSILDYTEHQIQPIAQNYNVNEAQAKAVRSALDNDAFTLIQGPPGSGKTKTICAMVGAMMTESFRHQPATNARLLAPVGGISVPAGASGTTLKKLLVCAPSNAAVDELVMRFKDGVKTLDGRMEKLSIVRLGRSDAINANIKDLTLEELVNAKLTLIAPKQGGPDRDIYEIMQEHKVTCDQLHVLRAQMDQHRSKGEAVPQAETQSFEGLKNKKGQLSLQIDKAREKQKTASRDIELERRRIQQGILDSAHVLCATLSGSGHEIFQSLNIEFETVIIDEAAQSIELSALIPLKYGCSKCILVGDPKQLPPTVLSKEAARFQYEQSLFARMEKNHPRDVHLLDTQYRMHPEISLFPSKTFYESRLRDGANMAKLRARPWHHAKIFAPYRFFDVKGMQSTHAKGRSLVNIAELEVAMQLYDRLLTDCRQYDFAGKIAIITPYKGQLRELRARFSRRYGEDIVSKVEFNTTDAFQGRESEIIIFSCVRATPHGIGFLSDIRRMNVGLTRAKCSLWVLGDSDTLSKGAFWKLLIMDARARSLYTDGDVLHLLQRPVLTVDMIREDVEMDGVGNSGSETSCTFPDRKQSDRQAAGQPSQPSAITSLVTGNKPASMPKSLTGPHNDGTVSSASHLGTSNYTSAAGKSSLPSTKSIGLVSTGGSRPRQAIRPDVSGPSGGRSGLNDLAKCRVCGSDTHFSHLCGNAAAWSAAHGDCLRCNSPLHFTSQCNEVRCLDCGDVGHSQNACQVPHNQRLGRAEKERVQQQEEELFREKARAQRRRAERQLGHHDAKIPSVKSSVPEQGKRGSSITTSHPHPSSGFSDDAKRKRESVSSPVDAPRGPKAMRPNADGVKLIIADQARIQTKPTSRSPDPGTGVRPVTGGKSNPSATPGGLLPKKKVKDSDIFLKRK